MQALKIILVPGGFGERGIEGKILAVKFARENNIPFFGICLGMQCAVIEYARNICGLQKANSSEFKKNNFSDIRFLLVFSTKNNNHLHSFCLFFL